MASTSEVPRIWLIEDNPDDAYFIRTAFERCLPEARVELFEEGDAALDRLSDIGEPERPRLILLDLNLSGRDGHQILAALKQEPRSVDIPVIVLTASRSDQDAQRSYALHANAHIVKPDDFRKFATLAESICSFWIRWVASGTLDTPRSMHATP